MNTRPLRDERGVALIVVVVAAFAMSIAVLGMVSLVLSQQNLARGDQDWQASLAAAESGIDDYVFRLNSDPNYFLHDEPPDGNEALDGWADIPGASNEGEFAYDIDTSETLDNGTIEITATGRVRDRTRTVRSTLRKQGFLDYLYFTNLETVDPAIYDLFSFWPSSDWAQANCTSYWYDGRHSSCQEIVFFDHDVLNGPVHSNDAIRISGSPSFNDAVTTSYDNPTGGPNYVDHDGSADPDLANDGDPNHQSVLTMPPTNTEIKLEADHEVGGTGCLFTGPTRIGFTASGNMWVSSPYSKDVGPDCPFDAAAGSGWPGENGPNLGIAYPDNGVIYVQSVPSDPTDPNYQADCTLPNGTAYPNGHPFKRWYGMSVGSAATTNMQFFIPWDDVTEYGCFAGDAFVQGQADGSPSLEGQVTIAAENDIVITEHLRYENDTSGTDVLGLVANNNVEVFHPVDSNGDNLTVSGGYTRGALDGLTIQAAILTLQHSFTVQNFADGDTLGELNVEGAIAQQYRGPVGMFSGTQAVHGYEKDYVYDQRLVYLSPPHYLDPVESAWHQVTWEEVKPVEPHE